MKYFFAREGKWSAQPMRWFCRGTSAGDPPSLLAPSHLFSLYSASSLETKFNFGLGWSEGIESPNFVGIVDLRLGKISMLRCKVFSTVEPLLTTTPDRRPPAYYGHSPWVQNASPFTTMLQKPLIYGHLSTPYSGHFSWPQTMHINAL